MEKCGKRWGSAISCCSHKYRLQREDKKGKSPKDDVRILSGDIVVQGEIGRQRG
jgi:hypothetical protein